MAAPGSSLAGPAGRLRHPQPVGLHSGRHRPLLPAPLPLCVWARREAGLSCCAASQGWLIISSGLGQLQALTGLPVAWCPGSEVEVRGHRGSRLGWQDWGSRTAALPTSALLSLPFPLTVHTHTCTHLHAHIYMHTRAHTYTQTLVYTCTHTQMHTRTCTCSHTCAHTGAHTCTQTFVHMCAHKQMGTHTCTRVQYICVHMHAQIHVHPCVHTCVHRQTRGFSPLLPHPVTQSMGTHPGEGWGSAYKLSFLPGLLTSSRPNWV